MKKLRLRTVMLVIPAVVALLVPAGIDADARAQGSSPQAACQTGKFAARLTGWTLNAKTPRGTADFTLTDKQLTVSVSSVALPDGTKLDILIDDDEVGVLEGLKDGEGKASITVSDKIEDGARVRILNDERPVVSGDLKCETAEGS
jgi:hypothetical protein